MWSLWSLTRYVRGKFPRAFEEAFEFARRKNKKLSFQVVLAKGGSPQIALILVSLMVQPHPPQPPDMVHTPTTTNEDPRLELLQRVTAQLDNLSLNLVQG